MLSFLNTQAVIVVIIQTALFLLECHENTKLETT